MRQLPCLPRSARWTVPAAIVAAAGGLLAGPMLASAGATPRLPASPAGRLLAAATRTAQQPPLSGTITETVPLGLPAPPAAGPLATPGPLTSLLAGSHTADVWYSDPEHYWLALPQRMSEDDLVRNGTSAWLWDSSANTVTLLTLPATAPVPPVPLTPQQAASQLLASAGPATRIRVGTSVTVAGQAAYQLVLAPTSPGSLIGQVRIAIGSRYHVPLRVEVFAKGAASPAAEIGFTAISFTRPPAADYAFTPPAGAKVTTARTGPAAVALAGGPGLPFRHSSDAAAPGSGRASGPGRAPLGDGILRLLALAAIHPCLPTHWWTSFDALLRVPIGTGNPAARAAVVRDLPAAVRVGRLGTV